MNFKELQLNQWKSDIRNGLDGLGGFSTSCHDAILYLQWNASLQWTLKLLSSYIVYIGGRLLGMICLDKGILIELLQEIQISYIFCAFESFWNIFWIMHKNWIFTQDGGATAIRLCKMRQVGTVKSFHHDTAFFNRYRPPSNGSVLPFLPSSHWFDHNG